MMHHAIDNRRGDHGITEIIAKVLKVDIRCDQCGSFTVTAVDDFKEERGVFGVLLLQPIEAQLVNQKDLRRGVLFQFLGKALIGEAGHQLREHVGGRGITAAVEVLTAHEKQGLGDMAFSGAGVACNDKPLLTSDKVQLRNLQDLCFIDTGLKAEVEVREELSLRKTGFLDSSLDSSFDPGGCLNGQEPFNQFCRWKPLLGGTGKLLVKDFLDSQKLQGLQMLSDSC